MEQKVGTYLAPDAAEELEEAFDRMERRWDDPDGWLIDEYGPHAREIVRRGESGSASPNVAYQLPYARDFLEELNHYERYKQAGKENGMKIQMQALSALAVHFTSDGVLHRLGRGAARGQINSAKARREKEGDNLQKLTERALAGLMAKLGRTPTADKVLKALWKYDDAFILDGIDDEAKAICWNDGPDCDRPRITKLSTWRNRLTEAKKKLDRP